MVPVCVCARKSCGHPALNPGDRCLMVGTREMHLRDGYCMACHPAPTATAPNWDQKVPYGTPPMPPTKKAPAPKKRRVPSLSTMERWVLNGMAKATDGCRVEPDGTCSHGKPSWLLELGMI